MPTVFRERGFRFFFYSNEGSPREPVHIHVEKADLEAKFLMMVEANRERIERAWNEFFG